MESYNIGPLYLIAFLYCNAFEIIQTIYALSYVQIMFYIVCIYKTKFVSI